MNALLRPDDIELTDDEAKAREVRDHFRRKHEEREPPEMEAWDHYGQPDSLFR